MYMGLVSLGPAYCAGSLYVNLRSYLRPSQTMVRLAQAMVRLEIRWRLSMTLKITMYRRVTQKQKAAMY